MRILIVEDHPEIATLIADRVKHAGYAADQVESLADAVESLTNFDYPVVLLDRRLPDGDGVSIIPTARTIRPGVRILLVTALRSIDERIVGLEAGADDYLTKPFSTDELVARIRASLRRPGGILLPHVAIAKLSFDINCNEAFVDGRPLILARSKLLLLGALVRRAGRAVPATTLMDEVYGNDDLSHSHALKMLVWRLRERLREQDAGVEIFAPRGVGYLIREARS